MARKRQIDPGFFTSEQIVRLSIPARLLFVGMFSQADDYGRLKGTGLSLKLTVFPGDVELSVAEVEGWRDEVVEAGLVKPYKGPDGTPLLWLPNWHRHQHINKMFDPHHHPHPDDPHRCCPKGSDVSGIGAGHVRDMSLQVGTGVGTGIGTGGGGGKRGRVPPLRLKDVKKKQHKGEGTDAES